MSYGEQIQLFCVVIYFECYVPLNRLHAVRLFSFLIFFCLLYYFYVAIFFIFIILTVILLFEMCCRGLFWCCMLRLIICVLFIERDSHTDVMYQPSQPPYTSDALRRMTNRGARCGAPRTNPYTRAESQKERRPWKPHQSSVVKKQRQGKEVQTRTGVERERRGPSIQSYQLTDRGADGTSRPLTSVLPTTRNTRACLGLVVRVFTQRWCSFG